jgi:ribose-phosphate pyrophosphokinase
VTTQRASRKNVDGRQGGGIDKTIDLGIGAIGRMLGRRVCAARAIYPEARVSGEFTMFTGSANPALAGAIARALDAQPGACVVDRFPDGNVAVQILESVRRKEVFLMQPTSPPANDHLVELLALADACRRAGADRITAILPYFGHGRADKRNRRREPIMERVVEELLEIVGIGHIVTVDLHAPQIEGFFRTPVDSLTAVPTLCQAMRGRLPDNLVVVSPDVGRVAMASQYARQCLDAPLVVLHKRRLSGIETEVTHIVGDVSGRACLVVDDMISTGTTMAESIAALLAADARPEITIAATHGLLLGNAREKLSHPAVREVLVTDTVRISERNWPQLRIISIAPLIAGAMKRLVADGSLGELYATPRSVSA